MFLPTHGFVFFLQFQKLYLSLSGVRCYFTLTKSISQMDCLDSNAQLSIYDLPNGLKCLSFFSKSARENLVYFCFDSVIFRYLI